MIERTTIIVRLWKRNCAVLTGIKFNESGLTAKISKREFSNDEIDYLGHRVELGQIEPLQTKTEEIEKISRPTTGRKQP